ncbi:MAG: Hpt domain-containing protein, partial [Calditrichia bacterium]|nr:Hpt domain-containing protein [Calditrichia bacterium]
KKALEEFINLDISIDEKLAGFIREFLSAIPDVIQTDQSHEKDRENDLNQFLTLFREALTEKMLEDGTKEDVYNLKDNREEVINAFDDVHQYYWGIISKEYAEWLSHKERDKYANNLIAWIEHLDFWYNLLEIQYIQPVIKYLVQIIKTLEYGKVPTPVDALIQEFIIRIVSSVNEITEEHATHFIEGVKDNGIEIDEVKAESLNNVRGTLWELWLSIFKSSLEKFDNPEQLTKYLNYSVERLDLLNEDEVSEALIKFIKIVNDNIEEWSETDFSGKIKTKLDSLIDPLINKNFVQFNDKIDEIEDACLSYKFDKDMKHAAPTIQLVEDDEEDETGSEQEVEEAETIEKVEEVEKDELEELFTEADIEGEEIIDSKTLSNEEIVDLFVQETSQFIELINDKTKILKSEPSDQKALNELLRAVHSIKSSARMMDKEEVGNYSEFLEDIYTKLVEEKGSVKDNIFELTETITKAISGSDFGSLDYNRLIEDFSDYLPKEEKPEAVEERAETPETVVTEEIQEIEEAQEEEKTEKDVNFFYLSEQDEELLHIFKDESFDVVKQVSGGINYLSQNPDDKKIIDEIDQGIHKVNSAAKMLGFSEIGVIMDSLEEILEVQKGKKESYFDVFTEIFKKSIQVTQELTENGKIEKQVYFSLIEELELAKNMDTETAEEVAKQLKDKGDKKIDKVMGLFIMEAQDYLQKIRQLFIELELTPDDPEKTYSVFRIMHTFKGAASMVKVESIQNLAHAFEDVLERYYQEKRTLSHSFLTLFRMSIEEFEYILNNVSKTGKEKNSPNYDNLLKRVNRFNEKLGDSEIDLEKPSHETQKVIAPAEIEGNEDNAVRISIKRLNELMNLIAELVINDNEISSKTRQLLDLIPTVETERKETNDLLRLADDLKKQHSEIIRDSEDKNKSVAFEQSKVLQPSLEKLYNKVESRKLNIAEFENNLKTSIKDMEQYVEKAAKLTHRLHDDILQARMVPISNLFDRFPLATKNIAKKYGKKVKLVIEGAQTELDRMLVEHLYERLLHSIRNAIAHGIELPKERKKVKKKELGIIKLEAKHEKGHVVITIEDDGRGLSVEKIKAYAIEKGFVEKGKAEKLSDIELYEFLFYPGFSTSEEVSEISGRGIGLDVVKREVNKINGDVEIISEPGEGMTLSFRFPTTLTVTQTMLVKINQNTYGIPVFYVEKTLDINSKDIAEENSNLLYYEDDTIYSVLFLQNIFKQEEDVEVKISDKNQWPCLIVEHHGTKYAFIVDYIDKRSEMIIRSLSPNLRNIPYISGGSVMPDASITFIIDVEEVIEDKIIHPQIQREDILDSSVVILKELDKKDIIKLDHKPNILVLDDSETFVAYMLSLLSVLNINIFPVASVDAAWKLLEKEEIDLAIVDLELPDISGYDFISQLEDKDEYRNLPILIITGKKIETVELLAKDLGVLGYLLKPFKEELLKEVFDKLFHVKGE